MFFAVMCTDKPDMDAVREAEMQAHTDYLMSHLDKIIWAGARQREGEAYGSFYLLRAASLADARAFADADPFAIAGVFASIEISDVRRGIFQPVLALGPAAETPPGGPR